MDTAYLLEVPHREDPTAALKLAIARFWLIAADLIKHYCSLEARACKTGANSV